MATETPTRKTNKGRDIVRFKPQGMALINSCPGYMDVFRREGCLRFCQQLQGHDVDITYKFVLNYDGTKSIVGDLIIPVTKQAISTTTGIPAEGERWFKGMTLDTNECGQFFKKEYQGIKLTTRAQRGYMMKDNDELLKVIQRYFTCEGRFNMVYLYHIRLLLHFTSKRALNLPYFLYKSIGKMAGKIQANLKSYENSLFHCVLIKLMIVKEMKKRKKTWESF